MKAATIEKTEDGYITSNRDGSTICDDFETTDLGQALFDVLCKMDQNRSESIGTFSGYEIAEAGKFLTAQGQVITENDVRATELQHEVCGEPDAPIATSETESTETQVEQN